jgi:hypothetical protein
MPTRPEPREDERRDQAPGRGTSGSPISQTGPAQPGPVDQPGQTAEAEKPTRQTP